MCFTDSSNPLSDDPSAGRIGVTRIREFFLTPPAIKQFQHLGAPARHAVAKHLLEGVESHELKPIHRQKKFGLHGFRVGTLRALMRVSGEQGLIEVLDQRASVYSADYRPRDWKEGVPLAQVLEQFAAATKSAASPVSSMDNAPAVEPSTDAPSVSQSATLEADALVLSLHRFVGASVDENTRALVDVVEADLATLRESLASQRETTDRDVGGLFEQVTGIEEHVRQGDARLAELMRAHATDRDATAKAIGSSTQTIHQLQADILTLITATSSNSAALEQFGLQAAEAGAEQRRLIELAHRLEAASRQHEDARPAQAAETASLHQQLNEAQTALREQSDLHRAYREQNQHTLETIRSELEADRNRAAASLGVLRQQLECVQAENRSRQATEEQLRSVLLEADQVMKTLRVDFDRWTRSPMKTFVRRCLAFFKIAR